MKFKKDLGSYGRVLYILFCTVLIIPLGVAAEDSQFSQSRASFDLAETGLIATGAGALILGAREGLIHGVARDEVRRELKALNNVPFEKSGLIGGDLKNVNQVGSSFPSNNAKVDVDLARRVAKSTKVRGVVLGGVGSVALAFARMKFSNRIKAEQQVEMVRTSDEAPVVATAK
jgi:hypothetical protein